MYTTLVSLLALAGAAQATSITAALTANSDFSMTLSILNYVNYTSTLNAMTGVSFLSPTNAAWTKYFASSQTLFATNGTALNKTNVANLFKYHVVSGLVEEAPEDGGSLFWNSAYTNSSFSGAQKIVALRSSSNFTYYGGDEKASTSATAITTWSGGLLQGIDTVLTPPYLPTRTATDLGLTAFAGALNDASLVNTIDTEKNANGSTGFTYLVPNNQAFADIANTVSTLTTAQLTSVLEYHIFKNRTAVAPCAPFESTAIFASGHSYDTLASNISLKFTSSSEGNFVNGAKIIAQNIPVRNGLMHIIDQVLNPSSSTATPSGSAGVAAFTGAMTQTTQVPITTMLPIMPTTSVSPVAAGAEAMRTAAPVLMVAAAGLAAFVV